MKVEDAVLILNDRAHNAYRSWFLDNDGLGPVRPSELRRRTGGNTDEEVLTKFEAIAVAEKYEREEWKRISDGVIEEYHPLLTRLRVAGD